MVDSKDENEAQNEPRSNKKLEAGAATNVDSEENSVDLDAAE